MNKTVLKKSRAEEVRFRWFGSTWPVTNDVIHAYPLHGSKPHEAEYDARDIRDLLVEHDRMQAALKIIANRGCAQSQSEGYRCSVPDGCSPCIARWALTRNS